MARQQDLSVLLYSGVSAPTIEVQEGTSTYYIGDLVHFDDSGQIEIASSAVISGIAMIDSTGSAGSAGDTQFMELIDFNALYLIAEATSTSADQVNVGDPAAITFTAGSTRALGHTASTGSGDVFVFGIYPGDVGVNGGRYIVRFDAATITAIGD